MGSNPTINIANKPADTVSQPSVLGPVAGSQVISIPKGDPTQRLAIPIYVGSSPDVAAPMNKPQRSNANKMSMPLPDADTLPAPPWMMFQQNAVRLPQQDSNSQKPNQKMQLPPDITQTPSVASPPTMGLNNQSQNQVQTQPEINPKAQPSVLTSKNPTPQKPQQIPKQAPKPGSDQNPQAGKKEEKSEKPEAEKTPSAAMQDDSFSQDTIRSLNSRLNNSVQSVRVAAAGDFLTLMIANPKLSKNPRYHEIVDAFLEKMLKDPSGDIRAAAYRTLESANVSEVSQGVYELLKERSENDGVFGVETDSINTILASVKVTQEAPEESKNQERTEHKEEKTKTSPHQS